MFVRLSAAPGFGEPFGIAFGAGAFFGAVLPGMFVFVAEYEGLIFVETDRFCFAGGRGILVLILLAIRDFISR